MPFDAIIRGGTIVDRSGAAACSDVYDGRIEAVDLGVLSRLFQACLQLKCLAALILLKKSKINRGFSHASCLADCQIDATGLVVAPGFIDSHTQDDGFLLTRPDMIPNIAVARACRPRQTCSTLEKRARSCIWGRKMLRPKCIVFLRLEDDDG